jgi:hypothetical protein
MISGLIVMAAMVRMFLFSRRNPDSAQREQATQAADMIAEILLQHLTFPAEGGLSWISGNKILSDRLKKPSWLMHLRMRRS